MKSRLLYTSFVIFLAIFVAANAFFSQTLSPLLVPLVQQHEEGAAREFLANIKGSPFYSDQSRYLNSIFDNIFAHEVDIQHLNTEKAITEYEKLLSLNPQSRDVLIELALLYKVSQNDEKARLFYAQAQAIDPWISVHELEELKR